MKLKWLVIETCTKGRIHQNWTAVFFFVNAAVFLWSDKIHFWICNNWALINPQKCNWQKSIRGCLQWETSQLTQIQESAERFSYLSFTEMNRKKWLLWMVAIYTSSYCISRNIKHNNLICTIVSIDVKYGIVCSKWYKTWKTSSMAV